MKLFHPFTDLILVSHGLFSIDDKSDTLHVMSHLFFMSDLQNCIDLT